MAFEWLIQVMLSVMAIAVPKLPPPMIAILPQTPKGAFAGFLFCFSTFCFNNIFVCLNNSVHNLPHLLLNYKKVYCSLPKLIYAY